MIYRGIVLGPPEDPGQAPVFFITAVRDFDDQSESGAATFWLREKDALFLLQELRRCLVDKEAEEEKLDASSQGS